MVCRGLGALLSKPGENHQVMPGVRGQQGGPGVLVINQKSVFGIRLQYINVVNKDNIKTQYYSMY